MAPLPLQDQLRQRRNGKRGRKPGVRIDRVKLAALISERGYVQERIAEHVGCSPAHLSNILSRRNLKVSRELRDKLAAVVEADADEITLKEAA